MRKASLIEWEGQPYRLDLARAERQRLHNIREKQGGVTVDVAVTLEDIVTRLVGDAPDVGDGIVQLKSLSTLVQVQTRSSFANGAPPGVDSPAERREVIQRVLARPGESRTIQRAAKSRARC